MVETHNYVDIRLGGEARYKKPVGIYWLQAASTTLLGHPPYNQIWTYRLPSLIGGLIAVLLTYWCMRGFTGPPEAFLAAALLALTVSLASEVKIAKTDAVLLAAIIGAEAVLMRIYLAAREAGRKHPDWKTVLAGWAAVGIGVLVKGPVIVAVLALTAGVISLWDREWRWLKATRPLSGLGVALVIVVPWAVAIGIATHGQFYEQALGNDFASKVMGGQESHGAPPGYYLLLSTITLWPATLFVLPGVAAAFTRRSTPHLRYLLAWAVPAWVMFELVPTKLPHYVLPAYPALAMLAAVWASRPADGAETRWTKISRYAACLQFTAGALAFAIGSIVLPELFGARTPWALMPVAIVGAGIASAAVAFVALRLPARGAVAAALAAAVFYPLLVWGMAPRLAQIWLSPRAAEHVAAEAKPGDPPVVLSGYVEPSLVFLLGTKTRIENGVQAGKVAGVQGGLALVGDKGRAAFLSGLQEMGATASKVDEVDGFNYSRGKPEHIFFYRVTPAYRDVTPPQE
jgi:4-amino-4-deoxy-L-arabinose transferase-like glycosyltransferase